MKSPEDVINYVSTNNIKWIDLHFVDISGRLRCSSVSASSLTKDSFSKGLDAGEIGEVFGDSSQLSLFPDHNTFSRVPWTDRTAMAHATATDPQTKKAHPLDSRAVIRKTLSNLKSAGYSDCHTSFDVEFYIFSTVENAVSPSGNGGAWTATSPEGMWEPNSFSIKPSRFQCPPYDMFKTLREQTGEVIENFKGYKTRYHTHGPGSSGQQRLAFEPTTLERAGDFMMDVKYTVWNYVALGGAFATFMPCPITSEPGNSLRMTISLRKKDINEMYDPSGEYQISQKARYFMGGIIKHAEALCLFLNPTPNSYLRIRKNGFQVGWTAKESGAMIRVENKINNDEFGKGITVLSPDPAVNPYLAISAVMAAGLEGIRKKIDPGDPVEKSRKKAKALPQRIEDALEALQNDLDFLKGYLSSEALSAYLDSKLEDINIREEMNPKEFKRYFGA